MNEDIYYVKELAYIYKRNDNKYCFNYYIFKN